MATFRRCTSGGRGGRWRRAGRSAEEGEDKRGSEQKKPEQLTFASLAWTGEVPPQKWMNFYTKVLSKFATTKGLKLKLSVEVAPESGISKQKLEETKAALRELGLCDDLTSMQTESNRIGVRTKFLHDSAWAGLAFPARRGEFRSRNMAR
jgi:hypothetical protein